MQARADVAEIAIIDAEGVQTCSQIRNAARYKDARVLYIPPPWSAVSTNLKFDTYKLLSDTVDDRI